MRAAAPLYLHRNKGWVRKESRKFPFVGPAAREELKWALFVQPGEKLGNIPLKLAESEIEIQRGGWEKKKKKNLASKAAPAAGAGGEGCVYINTSPGHIWDPWSC